MHLRRRVGQSDGSTPQTNQIRDLVSTVTHAPWDATVDPMRRLVVRWPRSPDLVMPSQTISSTLRGSDPLGDGWPFLVIGGGSVIVGGCVAAGSSVTPSAALSWAAAYLVLVVGVAQVALGLGQGVIIRPSVPTGVRAGELCGWNLGNAAVLVGALCRFETLLLIGSALLLAALALFAFFTRDRAGDHRWLAVGYRILLIVLAISVPAGVLLARMP